MRFDEFAVKECARSGQVMLMRTVAIVCLYGVLALFMGCARGGKQDIPLSDGQTYQLQPSGKMSVYPSGKAQEFQGAQPLHKLRVKRKNEGAAAKEPGCWRCTDCICNADDCSCTECTSC